MEGETSNAQSPNSEKKKRLRDISSNGDVLVNRGKPVSEKWKPVWIWLQSLNRTKIVDSAEVSAWLESNPTYATEMKQFHSHGVLVHYVQKCHQRLVHGRNCKGEGGKKPPAVVKKPPERRLTNEIRLPNGRFGSKVSREGSEEKQEDAYQLQWSQELVQNLLPPAKAAKYDSDKAEEASILDAETWREQWRLLLDTEKSNAEVL